MGRGGVRWEPGDAAKSGGIAPTERRELEKEQRSIGGRVGFVAATNQRRWATMVLR